MSYFQLPPGFSASDCFAPIYAIGVMLFGYKLACWVFTQISNIIRKGL